MNLFNTFSMLHGPEVLDSPVKARTSRGCTRRFRGDDPVGEWEDRFLFSTTVSGGTREITIHEKIGRFTVIRGKARIQLRRVGTSED